MFFLVPLCVLSTFTLIYIVFHGRAALLSEERADQRRLPAEGEGHNGQDIATTSGRACSRWTRLKLKEAIGSHPFIREVSIKRVYPFSIVIDVKEKKPSALWVDGDGNIRVLDETGTPYRGLAKRT